MIAAWAASLMLAALAAADTPPEARRLFETRQTDLVLLADRLGGLHRLNQVCPDYGNITVFRDSMRAVIEGERPVRTTREAMIKAFNEAYADMANRHGTCSADAEAAFRREARAAAAIVDRLSRGMGDPPS